MHITFIGGGNMATALIAGLSRANPDPARLRVFDPDQRARQRLQADYGVHACTDLRSATQDAEVLVLAVKPQVMGEVLKGLQGDVEKSQLVISVAAGITVTHIERALGSGQAVVRTMPNTPALLGAGITALFASPACNAAQKDVAEKIMGSVGRTVWVEQEQQMDVVTALSGSGPAYFYLLTEALRDAGIRQGLPAETANLLATSTAHGAGLMVHQAADDVAELRRRVTSPGGTTQAAIAVLQSGGLEKLVDQAVDAATRRGHDLGSETGKS